MTSLALRTGLGALAVLAVGGAAAPAAAPVATASTPSASVVAAATLGRCTWRLDRPLPLPAGFSTGRVESSDGRDRFVGTVADANLSNTHAALWRNGRVTLLPTPPGLQSAAEGVDRFGDVVGFVSPNAGALISPRPVRWRDHRLVRLAAPDGDATARHQRRRPGRR
jgi:hypothetical protein